LINRELNYIHVSELTVAAYSCQVDLTLSIFIALQSDRRSEPKLCFSELEAPIFFSLVFWHLSQKVGPDWFDILRTKHHSQQVYNLIVSI